MYTYTELIIANKDSFITNFNQFWSAELEKMDSGFTKSYQLSTGSRLRPILAAWGYYALFSVEEAQEKEKNYDLLLKNSYSIELLHKSSIIIDDLIDHDSMRNGAPTFHKEYGDFEAILFSIHLIGNAFKNLGVFSNEHILPGNSALGIGLLADTLTQMSLGGLEELSLNKSSEKIFNIKFIQDIIEKETSTLIQNSYLIGLLSSKKNPSSKIFNLTKDIGNLNGHIFQLYNDIEPFASTSKNEQHKGSLNFDFSSSRKNFVVAYLYGTANNTDKKTIESLIAHEQSDLTKKEIFDLIDKYNILSKVLDYGESLQKKIFKNLDALDAELDNKQYIHEFTLFIEHMIGTALDKLS
ncbi:polyprenyl synthetase family protein [Enterococcus sp. BWR-S5]|uniref:polyprenyl synthetase family protein n=1 Tax=Enterococcus sp. BWR-S5 TaxID=2787714 RepID=UPI00192375F8|nr:polyprenyl synthetase family protein [Enterococcus sp. BWR-S5]MBL1226756.1 polyprenyl synthetase family protein [Enterococcus sp. BWR-S5]